MSHELLDRFSQIQRCTLTRRTYASDLRDLESFVALHSSSIQTLTEEVALSWRIHLEERRLAPATIARKLSVSRAFYDYLRERIEIPMGRNPFARVKGPPLDPSEGKTPCPSMEEVQRLVRAIAPSTLRGLRDRAIVLLLFNQGFRVSEVARLERSQIGSINEYAIISLRGKGGRQISATLAPDVKCALEAHVKQSVRECQYVFRALGGDGHERNSSVTSPCDRPLSSRTIHAMIKRYARVAGIDPKRIRPHSGRVFFITQAYLQTRDIEQVARAVGHRNVATTRRYLRFHQSPDMHVALKVDLGLSTS